MSIILSDKAHTRTEIRYAYVKNGDVIEQYGYELDEE